VRGRERGAAAIGALIFGAGVWLGLAICAHVPLDPLAFGRDPLQAGILAVQAVALALPFAGAGFAVAITLQSEPAAAGRLYAADLAGAALGALLPLLILEPLGAPRLGALAGAVAGGAALAFAASAPRPLRARIAIAALVLGLAIPVAEPVLAPGLGPSKGIRHFLDPVTSPRAHLAFTRWHPLARVDVVEDAAPVTWAVPAEGALLPQHMIILDGDAATPILHLGRPSTELPSPAVPSLASMPPALPHATVDPDSVLVIGIGGGVDLLVALDQGARYVEGVELNPVNVGLMTGRYRAISGGVLADPRVHVRIGEGRSFLRQSRLRYDLIQLSLIDTYAASSAGAYALSESYLYTVEAFGDYLDHLSPRGALAVTRFLHEPPREILRLCSIARAALLRRGVSDPAQHIMVSAAGVYGTVIVTPEPVSVAIQQRFIAATRAHKAAIAYLPGGPIQNPIAELIASPNPEALVAAYPLRIDPVTDDRPFLFQYGRLGAARLFEQRSTRDELVAPVGQSLLVTVLFVTTVLGAAMILLPLLLRGRRPAKTAEDVAQPVRADLPALGYFIALGIAFILVEIAAMQQFALVLGHPTYAVSIVLCALLLASGGGSLLQAAAIGTNRRRLLAVAATLACLLALEAAFAHPVFPRLLQHPFPIRALAAVLWVGIPGVLQGMLLPSGVAILAARRPALVGWAFGANGFASVVGSVLSVLLAIAAGFRVTVLVAAVVYLAGAALLAARGDLAGAAPAAPRPAPVAGKSAARPRR
jgi:hypothetical protein